MRKIRANKEWKDTTKGNLARLVVTASAKERIIEIARRNKIPKSAVVETLLDWYGMGIKI